MNLVAMKTPEVENAAIAKFVRNKALELFELREKKRSLEKQEEMLRSDLKAFVEEYYETDTNIVLTDIVINIKTKERAALDKDQVRRLLSDVAFETCMKTTHFQTIEVSLAKA
jgi:S-adenosylmethionine synthetase